MEEKKERGDRRQNHHSARPAHQGSDNAPHSHVCIGPTKAPASDEPALQSEKYDTFILHVFQLSPGAAASTNDDGLYWLEGAELGRQKVLFLHPSHGRVAKPFGIQPGVNVLTWRSSQESESRDA